MPSAAITGAAGFLGRHLSELLAARGWRVTALVRDPELAVALLPAGVTCVQADLLDRHALTAALAGGFDLLFHAAADTSTWSREAPRQWQVNRDGTGNLLAAARAAGVGRLVHVSTIAVYGPHRQTITEDSPRIGWVPSLAYAESKAAAEDAVRAAGAAGQEVVIVNPTHIVGRYDTRNWARLICMVADASLPAVPPGGGCFAHGASVAQAMMRAAESAPSGSRYILGGPYAGFREFVELAARHLGVPVRAPALPAFALRAAARAGAAVTALTGKRPPVTPEEAAFACDRMHASSRRAESELGYATPSLEEMIAESADWLEQQGLLRRVT